MLSQNNNILVMKTKQVLLIIAVAALIILGTMAFFADKISIGIIHH